MKYAMLSPVAAAVCILVSAVSPARAQVGYSVSAGGRYHAEAASVPDIPYAEGDWSTMVSLEIYEGLGYWQFGVDFSDGTGGTNEIGNVITPQLNLMYYDSGVAAGIGVLTTYVEDEVNGDDWSDVYFQFNLGLGIPLGDSLSLNGTAHYLFEDFDDLSDFDTDNIDYTVGISWRF